MTPAMDALFAGPAGDRRRFLDRLVLAIDPGHGQRALDYEKAMRGRNRLLAEDSRDAPGSTRSRRRWPRPAWRSPRRAAETGAAARGDDRQAAGRRPVSAAAIALDGVVERQSSTARPSMSRNDCAAALAAGRGRDRAAGRTLDGPHRADLLVRHRPKDMPARTLLDRRAEGAAGRAGACRMRG